MNLLDRIEDIAKVHGIEIDLEGIDAFRSSIGGVSGYERLLVEYNGEGELEKVSLKAFYNPQPPIEVILESPYPLDFGSGGTRTLSSEHVLYSKRS